MSLTSTKHREDKELNMTEIRNSLINVIDHIVESEMEGRVDAEDSYYPTYRALQDLLEKVEDENPYRYMKFSDTDEDDIHHCLRCKYTGDDWAEHDDFINDDGSNERLCPKCYSQSYFIASYEERRGELHV